MSIYIFLILWAALNAIKQLLIFSAVFGKRRRPRTPGPISTEESPTIAVIKPLCGTNGFLRENLESYFGQDYPAERFKIYFCFESPSDPAMATVRDLASHYPSVRTAYVMGPWPDYANPKIRNIAPAYPMTREEWIYCSDANIRIPRDFLRRLVGTARTTQAALVTSWFRRIDASPGPSSLVEEIIMSGAYYKAILLSERFGFVPASAKTLFYRKESLERVGGLSLVGSVFSDDVKLGSAIRKSGGKVVGMGPVVEQSQENRSWSDFFSRHYRWSIGRKWLSPSTFAIEPLFYTAPSILSLFLCLRSLVHLGWIWLITAVVLWHFVTDISVYFLVERPTSKKASLFLFWWLPCECFLLAIWLGALFGNQIVWNRKRFLLSSGTRMTRL